MRRTPEQVEALDHEALSNLQLIAMSFRCGRVPAVKAPDGAGVIQRLLIRCANFNSEDSSRLLTAITATIILFSMSTLIAILNSLPDIIHTPEWSRYMPAIAIFIALIISVYFSEVIAFRVGKSKLIVEGYKRRMAEKAARRIAERRKHYRPISARELDA